VFGVVECSCVCSVWCVVCGEINGWQLHRVTIHSVVHYAYNKSQEKSIGTNTSLYVNVIKKACCLQNGMLAANMPF